MAGGSVDPVVRRGHQPELDGRRHGPSEPRAQETPARRPCPSSDRAHDRSTAATTSRARSPARSRPTRPDTPPPRSFDVERHRHRGPVRGPDVEDRRGGGRRLARRAGLVVGDRLGRDQSRRGPGDEQARRVGPAEGRAAVETDQRPAHRSTGHCVVGPDDRPVGQHGDPGGQAGDLEDGLGSAGRAHLDQVPAAGQSRREGDDAAVLDHPQAGAEGQDAGQAAGRDLRLAPLGEPGLVEEEPELTDRGVPGRVAIDPDRDRPRRLARSRPRRRGG